MGLHSSFSYVLRAPFFIPIRTASAPIPYADGDLTLTLVPPSVFLRPSRFSHHHCALAILASACSHSHHGSPHARARFSMPSSPSPSRRTIVRAIITAGSPLCSTSPSIFSFPASRAQDPSSLTDHRLSLGESPPCPPSVQHFAATIQNPRLISPVLHLL